MMSHDVPIENLLATGERIAAPAEAAGWAKIADQRTWNDESARDPLAFWTACGERVAWQTPPHTTLEGTIGDARWYVGGRLNATCWRKRAASQTRFAPTAWVRATASASTCRSRSKGSFRCSLARGSAPSIA
jgi:hypothetical protein